MDDVNDAIFYRALPVSCLSLLMVMVGRVTCALPWRDAYSSPTLNPTFLPRRRSACRGAEKQLYRFDIYGHGRPLMPAC